MKRLLVLVMFCMVSFFGYTQSFVSYQQDSMRSIKISKTIDDRVLKVEIDNFGTDTVYINLYSEDDCIVESAVVNPGKHYTYKIYIKYIDEYIDLVEVEAKNYIATKQF